MPWDRATLALTLLAIDPTGLGGANIRARTGPVRDAFLEALAVLPSPASKLHPAMDDDSLFGGLDLTRTLQTGTLTQNKGLLRQYPTHVLTMADRCEPDLAARLAMAMDAGTLQTLVTLDEGADADEAAPAALTERMAFHITLDLATRDIGLLPDEVEITRAQRLLPSLATPDDTIMTLSQICISLGIDSARAPIFALRAARAHAALRGDTAIAPQDIETAAALTLAHRATMLPPTDLPPEEQEADPAPPPSPQDIGQLEDRVLEAVMTHLPEGLLDQIKVTGRLGSGSGAGAKHRGNRRGRPKPARPGRFSGRNRLDLMATLRTAAPWQKLRGGGQGHIKVQPSDFRIKQYEDKSDRVLIFTVDASGSAAMARLAEAKGAVELLLADAYARRDHVGLIAFRGEAADTLLPPTRSLVQTKRRLAALPGGGGTPLAAGLLEAMAMAETTRRQGMSPCIVILTDGRANIALDGTADRPKACSDADAVSAQIRTNGIDSIVLDLGNRPSRYLSELAARMDGMYMPVPRADAHKMSGAVSAALKDQT
ncbi:magnesium chelatase subunit D [Pseudooctadecabacter jejudonensis]|uniref:Magnesium-chelatase 60 kDa subunit n=1 Tax=Pseudooctadecabacter jejudonensis TaxID=1391910 RepID=A0A1Y5S703_9RHOB|nr:magnesium chelatase subunit D [Pseudooctadecabacter jejudonensis]SLN32964.1 Magnesium-chelatase 60 kDa subunit [Pseudooctadecabacter jejudonensis]